MALNGERGTSGPVFLTCTIKQSKVTVGRGRVLYIPMTGSQETEFIWVLVDEGVIFMVHVLKAVSSGQA